MKSLSSRFDRYALGRRRFMAGTAGLVSAGLVSQSALARFFQDASQMTGVDPEVWNPETIQALAGTIEVDTAAEVHAVVPESATGDLQYWNVGPTQASPAITVQIYDEFQAAFQQYYPEIALENQNIGYNDLLDTLRTAAAGGAAPDVAKLPILWGVEFAARGQLQEIVSRTSA